MCKEVGVMMRESGVSVRRRKSNKDNNFGILPEEAKRLVDSENNLLIYELLRSYAEKTRKEVCFCKRCKQFYVYKRRSNNGCTKELCIVCANTVNEYEDIKEGIKESKVETEKEGIICSNFDELEQLIDEVFSDEICANNSGEVVNDAFDNKIFKFDIEEEYDSNKYPLFAYL